MRTGLARGTFRPLQPSGRNSRTRASRSKKSASSPRPTALPTSIEQWLDTFAQSFFGALAEPDRLSARAEVADLLRPVLMDETRTWVADYVRLRFRATLLP